MAQVQRLSAFGFAAVAAFVSIALQGQVGDPGTLIQEKLVAQIKLTKTAADHSDIVTAGDIVVLHKDGMMMCSTASSYAFSNTYANGVLAANLKNRAKDAAKGWLKGAFTGGASDVMGAANNGCPTRKFVSGEKFWITGVTLQKDGILVSTYSDPYNDTRYFGEIKFPFQKGAPIPAPDAFVKTVEEVITVAPQDDKGGDQNAQGNQGGGNQGGGNQGGGNQGQQQAASAAPASAPAAPLQTIAPPPPPADAPPPTIAVGQTKDQVVAGFGQPVRTAKLAGTKEIYFYKDMKVTFTNGKVSNVE
jgi:hypothetical protein